MRRKALTLIAAGGLIAAAAIPALAAPGDVEVRANKINGKQETPNKGDEDGTGSAEFTLKPKKEKVCYLIEFQDIEAPTAGHIHKGLKGDDGPIKIELFEDEAGASSPIEDCVKAEEKQINKVAKNAERYYVNLHNGEFPDGAIRGQLKGGTPEDPQQ
jgi:CHRD domain